MGRRSASTCTCCAREVLRYKPDVVVVQLIHNDFDESYRFLRTRYASSFLKIGSADGGVVEELPPSDFEPAAGRQAAQLPHLPLPLLRDQPLPAGEVVSRCCRGRRGLVAPSFI